MEQAGVHLDVTYQRQAWGSEPAFSHWLTVKRRFGEGGVEEEEVNKSFDLLSARSAMKRQLVCDFI